MACRRRLISSSGIAARRHVCGRAPTLMMHFISYDSIPVLASNISHAKSSTRTYFRSRVDFFAHAHLPSDRRTDLLRYDGTCDLQPSTRAAILASSFLSEQPLLNSFDAHVYRMAQAGRIIAGIWTHLPVTKEPRWFGASIVNRRRKL